MRGCHCLCPSKHPGRRICTQEVDTTLVYNTEQLGDVDVPMCRPCADVALGRPAGPIIPGEVLADDGRELGS